MYYLLLLRFIKLQAAQKVKTTIINTIALLSPPHFLNHAMWVCITAYSDFVIGNLGFCCCPC